MKNEQTYLFGEQERGIHWGVLSFGVSHPVGKHDSPLPPLQHISKMGCLGSLLPEREDVMQTGLAPLGAHLLGGVPRRKQLSVTALGHLAGLLPQGGILAAGPGRNRVH